MFPCNTWLADLPTTPVKAHVRNTPTWASSQPASKAGDVFLSLHGFQQPKKAPGLYGEQGIHLIQQHGLPQSLVFAAWHPGPLLNYTHRVGSCRNSPCRCWQWFQFLPAGHHVCSLEECNHSWLFSAPWPIWFWMCSHFPLFLGSTPAAKEREERNGSGPHLICRLWQTFLLGRSRSGSSKTHLILAPVCPNRAAAVQWLRAQSQMEEGVSAGCSMHC